LTTGHDLGDRPFFDEFFLREPALALDQLALHDGEHAAEALQRQKSEGQKQVGQGLGTGAFVAGYHPAIILDFGVYCSILLSRAKCQPCRPVKDEDGSHDLP
jgi:hypothetical protein